ncbi:MAG: ABC transporter permease [Acidobacteriota bacterium]
MRRLRALFARKRLDGEFDEEAHAHIDLATDDYIARGYSSEEARRLARVKFGAKESAKDAHRDARGWAWLETLLYDVRYAFRGLARDRGFALAVVVMLTLSIALNVTAFRVLDAALLRGFPGVKENRRMLFVDEVFPRPGCCVSFLDFEQWRAQSHSFQGLAFTVGKQKTVGENGNDPRDLWVEELTVNGFGLLGVRPFMGRDLNSADASAGAAPVVIVSHEYWSTRLGRRSDAIGQRVLINGTPTTIVGVLPEGFDFLQRSGVFQPLVESAELRRPDANGSTVFGRLVDGVSEADARRELEVINARLAEESPATNRDVRPSVRNFMDAFGGANAALTYGSFWAGAWLVVAIACANLANLALARAQGRSRELCTQMALGAGRGRIARQMLLESFVLGAMAGLLAWGVSAWSVRAWAIANEAANGNRDYSAGPGTVAYVVMVTLIAAMAIALAPIGRLWRLDVNGALRGESRSSTHGQSAKRLAGALVAAQMALAIVLMASAGVLGHSLWNVLHAEIGVREPERVLVGKVTLPPARYGSAESRAAFFEALQARIATTAGVEQAGVADGRPVADFEPLPVEFEREAGASRGAPVFHASPGYFGTIGASLRMGRDFDARGSAGERAGGDCEPAIRGHVLSRAECDRAAIPAVSKASS